MTSAAERPAQSSHVRVQAAGLALLAALAVLIWTEPRWSPRLQPAWFDTYQIFAPRRIASMPVTVVEIDEKSLAQFGQWPWPRAKLASLVRAVEHAQPAAIGIDILMKEPDRFSGDSELARAIAGGRVVVGLFGTPEPTGVEPVAPPFVVVDRAASRQGPALPVTVPSYAGALVNIDEIDRAAAGHGLLSAGSADSVIRTLPLVTRIHDRLVPSLPMEMLRVALAVPEIRLYSRGTAVETVAVGDFVAPTEADGELRIYYSDHDPRRYVSAADVLDGRVDPQHLESKLVLIGTGGLGMVDSQNTPLGQRMPGSEIFAQLLENLYDQTWLVRPSWAAALELALFVVLGLTLIWITPRWKPGAAALVATLSIALVLALGFAAFLRFRMVFDASAPAVGLLVLFSVLLLLTLQEAGRQRRRLERVIQKQREEAAYVAGEMEAAKRIQTGILPRADALANEPRVELAATMTPAREVGGDLYDFFPLDADRLFFLVGDVAGKGLSASMFMAVSKALYKSSALRTPSASVGELMRLANDELSRDNPEMYFVTTFAGVLDLESGALSYCNAGHDSPYLLGRSGAELGRLDEGAGPPLCTVEGFAYVAADRRLRAEDVVCLVTDGVTDAKNPRGERYGTARLRAVLSALREGRRTARAVVDAVSADVRAFAAGAEPTDDVTVLALRWIGPR
ncbi:MAG TPA: CHASE2 domain-containing protein [Casimicrobiaceae bacterium]|nr:CHASE2 domain-containing protein [Casimicrobiaceae bacterium]